MCVCVCESEREESYFHIMVKSCYITKTHQCVRWAKGSRRGGDAAIRDDVMSINPGGCGFVIVT